MRELVLLIQSSVWFCSVSVIMHMLCGPCVHIRHLLEECDFRWLRELSSKKPHHCWHRFHVGAGSFSAACAPAACGSEEEDQGTPWKERRYTVTKTEEYQSPQSWKSLCWINMQPFRHRKSNRSTHLMMFSMEALWRKKALTTGVPDGTRGALHRKESSDKTLWKDWKFSSPWGFTVTRWQSSVSITRSRMIGLASRESC